MTELKVKQVSDEAMDEEALAIFREELMAFLDGHPGCAPEEIKDWVRGIAPVDPRQQAVQHAALVGGMLVEALLEEELVSGDAAEFVIQGGHEALADLINGNLGGLPSLATNVLATLFECIPQTVLGQVMIKQWEYELLGDK